MSKTYRRNLVRLGTQSAQVALAVPQVVGHRVTRMMNAGPVPNTRDMREFSRMSAEKTTAFAQSWFAIGMEMMRANQRLALTMMGSWFSVTGLGRHSQQMQSAALGIAVKGIAPVHRTVVANAKRLASLKP